MTELHPAMKILSSYVVALFGIKRIGEQRYRVQHCGSGTLITINGVFGILTAGHVIETMEPFETWAIQSFSGYGGRARMHRFKRTEQTERFGRNYAETDGPDIGFIRLPEEISLLPPNEMSFYNITKRHDEARSRQSPIPMSQFTIFALAGVIGESSETVEREDGIDVTTTMMIAPAHIIDKTERFDMDYYTLKVGPTRGLRQGISYEGVSGGPLFATRNDGAGLNDRFVIGVAYRQSDEDENGNRTISCHGFKSVYEQMCTVITLAFADPRVYMPGG